MRETLNRAPIAMLPANQAMPYTPVSSPYAEARRFGETMGPTAAGMIDPCTPIPSPHSDTPTKLGQNPPEERQWRIQRSDKGQRDENADPYPVEQAPEDQRSGATHRHRGRIEDRRERGGYGPGLLEVVGNDRKIGEPGTDEGRCRQIHPEDSWETLGGHLNWTHFEILGLRVEQSSERQQRQHDRARDSQSRECDLVVMLADCQDQGDQQRAEHRPELVEGFVYAEGPAIAHLLRRVREPPIVMGQ